MQLPNYGSFRRSFFTAMILLVFRKFWCLQMVSLKFVLIVCDSLFLYHHVLVESKFFHRSPCALTNFSPVLKVKLKFWINKNRFACNLIHFRWAEHCWCLLCTFPLQKFSLYTLFYRIFTLNTWLQVKRSFPALHTTINKIKMINYMYMFNQPLFFPAVHRCSILCSYQFVTSPLKLAEKYECEVFDCEGMKN